MFLLLAVIALEFIDPFTFSFTVEGFPLSAAEVCFIIIGVRYFKVDMIKNPVFISVFIIFLGMILSAFFLENVFDNISRTSAFMILVVASYGFSRYIFQESKQNFLLILFIATLAYWTYYVIQLYMSGLISFDYHFNSPFQKTETINAHNVGLQVSISGIFIFGYLLFQKNYIFKLLGYGFLTVSLIVCMLVHSRSNFLFTAVVGVILLFYKSNIKVTARSVLSLGFLALFGYFVYTFLFDYITSLGAGIGKRFDAGDTEYIESTTRGRTLVYSFFLDFIGSNFFGMGLVRAKFRIMQEGFKNLGMHNQYATFIVAGGWISGIGVILLIRNILLQFSQLILQRVTLSRYKTAIVFSLLVYLITIATLEVGSIVFFIMIGFLMNFKELLVRVSVPEPKIRLAQT